MFNHFGFTAKFLDDENIISKMNLLLQLERMDPYSNDTTLQERIQVSLQYIPPKHRQYVLALFANTIYFPNAFSKSVLQHLLNSLMFRYRIDWKNIGNECLILEQDPTGIVNDFLRVNHIHGRLDKETFQRTQQVSTFVKTALVNLAHGSQIQEVENVIPFLSRKYWIVLVDNSLSGTSLCSDLEKLLCLANNVDKKPKIILLIRTFTKMAKDIVAYKFANYIADRVIEIDYGLLLDNRYTISSDIDRWHECVFFNRQDTFEGVVEACRWLSGSDPYKEDKLLSDHKKNSGGDETMTFGFKDCGITFVSSENCPSDSLPLLWYQKDGFYVPPFPRVLSRIGGSAYV